MTVVMSAFITAFLGVGPAMALGAALANHGNTSAVPECVQAVSTPITIASRFLKWL